MPISSYVIDTYGTRKLIYVDEKTTFEKALILLQEKNFPPNEAYLVVRTSDSGYRISQFFNLEYFIYLAGLEWFRKPVYQFPLKKSVYVVPTNTHENNRSIKNWIVNHPEEYVTITDKDQVIGLLTNPNLSGEPTFFGENALNDLHGRYISLIGQTLIEDRAPKPVCPYCHHKGHCLVSYEMNALICEECGKIRWHL